MQYPPPMLFAASKPYFFFTAVSPKDMNFSPAAGDAALSGFLSRHNANTESSSSAANKTDGEGFSGNINFTELRFVMIPLLCARALLSVCSYSANFSEQFFSAKPLLDFILPSELNLITAF